jgi:hypothetical protein
MMCLETPAELAARTMGGDPVAFAVRLDFICGEFVGELLHFNQSSMHVSITS